MATVSLVRPLPRLADRFSRDLVFQSFGLDVGLRNLRAFGVSISFASPG